jgi:hypothetical protein
VPPKPLEMLPPVELLSFGTSGAKNTMNRGQPDSWSRTFPDAAGSDMSFGSPMCRASQLVPRCAFIACTAGHTDPKPVCPSEKPR